MQRRLPIQVSMTAATLALTFGSTGASAQSHVQYGRITNVVATTVDSSTSRNVGTVVGGGIGLATGGGQSVRLLCGE